DNGASSVLGWVVEVMGSRGWGGEGTGRVGESVAGCGGNWGEQEQFKTWEGERECTV
nr:hypothetical protein [Tanacetum cinerariifolium]